MSGRIEKIISGGKEYPFNQVKLEKKPDDLNLKGKILTTELIDDETGDIFKCESEILSTVLIK